MNMAPKITITKIAQRAGVSIATVSRIITQKGTVSPATRQKVLQAMDELEFDAAAIKANSSYQAILGFIPDFFNPFYAPIIDGIQQTAHESGFEVFWVPTKDIFSNNMFYFQMLREGRFKGVIWLSSAPPTSLLDLIGKHCPFIMCCEYPEDYDCSYISIDDKTAAYRAVNHLIASGCKEIGLVNCSLKYKYARHRKEGYLEALKNAGITPNPEWSISVPYIDYTLAYSAVSQTLNANHMPDAFFACSDLFAAAVINVAQKHDIRVPEDLSVIGFDNTETSRLILPSLTTVGQPGFQIGQQACSVLLEKIANPTLPERHILLNTELIIRKSTR